MPIVWTRGGHYQRVDFDNEADFEASVIEVQDLLFGAGRIYIDVKKRIGLKGLQQNVPDGYLLDLNGPTPKLFVVENELASHDPLRHIAVQVCNPFVCISRSGGGPTRIRHNVAGLGEKDNAFTWLDKAYEAHSSGPLANDILDLPDFDPIRSDPRLAVLQKKIGLAP